MGAVGGLLGMSGGAGGSGFSGPKGGAIVNTTDPTQISNAYTGVQNSMQSQQDLLKAIQAQNGLGNQTNVYNQLQNVANGQGPNPAQAMLNQATGANVANQAALMAGQRGAGSNVGLMARQAAQQGAGIQQNAAGQAATMQANQSLGALGQMGGMADTMASNQIGQQNANTQSQQSEQSQLLGAQQAVNNANVGMQSNINGVNGQLANTQMQGGQAMLGGLMNGSALKGLLAEGGDVPDTSVPTFAADSGAAALSGADQGGGGGGLKKAMGLLALAGGGEASAYPGASKFGAFLSKSMDASQPGSTQAPTFGSNAGADALRKGASNLTNRSTGNKPIPSGEQAGGAQDIPGLGGTGEDRVMVGAGGGRVPVMLSPGEKKLSPKAVEEVKRGASPMAVGETVPGKPKVGGAKNSYANDVVPDKAEPGTIIVPRSKTKSKNPDRASAEFVHRVLAKRRIGG